MAGQQQPANDGGVQQQQAGSGSGGGSLPYPAPPAVYMQQFQDQHKLNEELRKFWTQMQTDVAEHSEALQDFKNQALPLARIKKIMKSDEDVRMISAEAPVLFARACEFFIQELTIRSWSAAQEFKRRTLQRSDVATAITRTDIFDFLVDIVPREEANELANGGDAAAAAQLAAVAMPPMALGQAPPIPLAMFPPGAQQGQQQQQQQNFLPSTGQQPQFMQAPPGQQQFMQQQQQQQQGGPGNQGQGGQGMPYNMAYMAPPPPFNFQLGAPSQQQPGMHFPPPQ